MSCHIPIHLRHRESHQHQEIHIASIHHVPIHLVILRFRKLFFHIFNRTLAVVAHVYEFDRQIKLLKQRLHLHSQNSRIIGIIVYNQNSFGQVSQCKVSLLP